MTVVADTLLADVAFALHVEVERIALRHLAVGAQAECYDVLIEGERRAVLKQFHPQFRYATASYVGREFNVLSRFSGATQHFELAGCPTPLALFQSHRAYLMDVAEGTPLPTLLRSRSATPRSESVVIGGLLAALQIFHSTTGECYGDFHPDNIIVSSSVHGPRLLFFDPCMANPAYYTPAQWTDGDLLSTDLGYWIFTECARSWRLLRNDFLGSCRRLRFARRLMREAMALQGDELRPRVSRVVAWHAQRMAVEHGYRAAAVALYAKYISAYVCGL